MLRKIGLSKTIFCLALLSIYISGFAADKDITEVGRYMTVKNKPSHDQTDLLSQTIQMRFPENIRTVGDAMGYLLRYSGYSLVDDSRQNVALKKTLKKPLPLVDREFQPMALKDALITLAGPAFTLVQDPLNREIDFHVKSSFVKPSFQGA